MKFLSSKDIDESHHQSLGYFEYNCMPFGLANAPATYQRLMENCLRDLNLNICFIYLDDLIVFSKTFEDHVKRLQSIFQCIRENNLKVRRYDKTTVSH